MSLLQAQPWTKRIVCFPLPTVTYWTLFVPKFAKCDWPTKVPTGVELLHALNRNKPSMEKAKQIFLNVGIQIVFIGIAGMYAAQILSATVQFKTSFFSVIFEQRF